MPAVRQLALHLPGLLHSSMLLVSQHQAELMRACVQGGLRDDTSLIVIDLLPAGLEFPRACGRRRLRSMTTKQMLDRAAEPGPASVQPTPSYSPPKKQQSGGFCCFA